MSISTTIKNQLIAKIQNLSSVQQTYGHEDFAPRGFPAVMVVMDGMDGEFISNFENRRIYTFRVTVVFPIDKDMPGLPADTNRLEFAEQTIATVLDEIINAIDTDFELDGDPVLFVGAADAIWGEAPLESGIAKAGQVRLSVSTDFRVQ